MAQPVKRSINIWINGKEVENNVKSISSEFTKLKNSLALTTRGTKEYQDKASELKRVKGILDEHNNSIKATAGFWGTLKNQFKSILPIASVTGAITLIGKLGKEFKDLSIRLEADSRKANIVFGDSLAYVSVEAEKLAKKMGVTKNEFIGMASATGDLLIPLGFTRKEAAEMSVKLQSLTGALDEWSQGKFGAKDISERLQKAVLGEAESLKQLGIGIRKDSEEYKTMVKNYQERERMTQAQAEAMTMLTLIQQKSTDAQSAYLMGGNELLRMQKSLTSTFNTYKEKIVEWFQTPVSEKLEQERITVNALTIQLADANLTYEQRKKILDQLNSIAPDVVKGLDAENLNYAQLRENVRLYNEEMINKIILSKKDADIQKQNEDVANIRMKRIEAEQKIMLALSEINSKIQATSNISKENALKANEALMNENLTIEQKVKLLEEVAKTNKMGFQFYAGSFSVINNTQRDLNNLIQEENELANTSNKMSEERVKLAESLGIKAQEQNTEKRTSIELTKEERVEIEKQQKELEKQLEAEQKYREQVILQSKTLIEQEKVAFDDRLKKAGLFGKQKETLTAQQKLALEALEAEHVLKMDEIANKFFISDIEKEKQKFETQQKLAEINHKNELASLAGKHDEIKEAEEAFREEQLTAQIEFLNRSINSIYETLNQDGEFKSLDEAILSEEGNEALQERLLTLQETLAGVNLEMANIRAPKELEQKDIFGNTPTDYENANKRNEDTIDNINKVSQRLTLHSDTYKAVNTAMSSFENNRLERLNQTYEKEKLALKDKLDSGRITQEQYNEQIKQIDEKMAEEQAKIKRKQAMREKVSALFDVAVNTAAGISKAIAASPLTVGLPWSALIGIAGAAQAAAIATAPLPSYDKGGRIFNNQVARIHEGEMIFTKDSVNNNELGPLLEYAMQVQENKPPQLQGFKKGGRIGGFVARMADKRNENRAKLGLRGTEEYNRAHGKTQDSKQDESAGSSNIEQQMLSELRRISGYLTDPNNRRAVITNDLMRENNKEQELLQSLTNVKR